MQVITDAAIEAAPTYNETEIRFHILDPIIRLLGYPGADDVYLILEEKLEYPYQHIGRRSKKDLPLGRSDYRAGVKGARGSFVIEAKAGNVAIGGREVEQAHSYAAHAQVGANYFVLCNGSVLTVHETLSGPRASPVVEIALAEINSKRSLALTFCSIV
jgi:predicted type IV restriction endonuclease